MDVLQREIETTTTTNEWMGECTCERERQRQIGSETTDDQVKKDERKNEY